MLHILHDGVLNSNSRIFYGLQLSAHFRKDVRRFKRGHHCLESVFDIASNELHQLNLQLDRHNGCFHFCDISVSLRNIRFHTANCLRPACNACGKLSHFGGGFLRCLRKLVQFAFRPAHGFLHALLKFLRLFGQLFQR